MNIFVAALLLYQTTLEDFLEKSAEDRLLEYSDLVGVERMVRMRTVNARRPRLSPALTKPITLQTRFNVEMARRLEAMQLPPSSPIDVATSSSSRDIGDSDLGLY